MIWIRLGSHQAPRAPLFSQPSIRYYGPLVSAYYLNCVLIMLMWREKGNMQLFNSLTNHFPKFPFTVHHSDTPYEPGGCSQRAKGRAHRQQQAGDAVSDRSCRVELHSWGAWVWQGMGKTNLRKYLVLDSATCLLWANRWKNVFLPSSAWVAHDQLPPLASMYSILVRLFGAMPQKSLPSEVWSSPAPQGLPCM